MLNTIIEKFDKILKYLPIEKNDLYEYIVIGILFLVLLFLYYDKTVELIKDYFIKWVMSAFLRLSFLMIVPLFAYWGLEITFLSDPHLNSWVHLFLSTLILPVVPYIILLIYRVTFLLVRFFIINIIKFFKNLKNKEIKEAE